VHGATRGGAAVILLQDAQHVLGVQGDYGLGVVPHEGKYKLIQMLRNASTRNRNLHRLLNQSLVEAVEASATTEGLESLRDMVKQAQEKQDQLDADGYIRSLWVTP
jgi:hypothetical protein